MKHVIIPYFIPHQGCPFQCIFCNQVSISGETAPFPSGSDIRTRIEAFGTATPPGGVEVAFYGGTFTLLPEQKQRELLQAVHPFLESGQVGGIRVSTRPDALDGATARFLRDMGVSTVELGVQSMDDEVLVSSGRGYGSDSVAAACRHLQAEKLACGIQLMTGLPGDTPFKSAASFDRAIALRPDFLRIYPTLVIAGTGLEREYRSGSFAPQTLEEAIALGKILLHRALVAGVPVVRMGVHPSEDLAGPDTIISGPFHPAFRQLAESGLCYDLIEGLCSGILPGNGAIITCAPSRTSDTSGHRRINLDRLREKLAINASIRQDVSLSRFEFEVESCGVKRRGDLVRDLSYVWNENGKTFFPSMVSSRIFHKIQ